MVFPFIVEVWCRRYASSSIRTPVGPPHRCSFLFVLADRMIVTLTFGTFYA